VAGQLTVSPATLTITAKDVPSKTYGTALAFAGTEYTVTGLKNSDAVSGVALSSPGAAPTAPVGSYDITPSQAAGTGLNNYTISYVAGQLTVSPATLTI